MEELQKKIEAVLKKAGLSGGDCHLWMSRLSVAGERAQRVFLEAVADDRDMLVFFTRDLRNRIDAGSDPEKIASVIRDEKEYFTGILNKARI